MLLGCTERDNVTTSPRRLVVGWVHDICDSSNLPGLSREITKCEQELADIIDHDPDQNEVKN